MRVAQGWSSLSESPLELLATCNVQVTPLLLFTALGGRGLPHIWRPQGWYEKAELLTALVIFFTLSIGSKSDAWSLR